MLEKIQRGGDGIVNRAGIPEVAETMAPHVGVSANRMTIRLVAGGDKKPHVFVEFSNASYAYTVVVPFASVSERGVLRDGNGIKTLENKFPVAPRGENCVKVPIPNAGTQLYTAPTPSKGGTPGPWGGRFDKDSTLRLCCPNSEKMLFVKRVSH